MPICRAFSDYGSNRYRAIRGDPAYKGTGGRLVPFGRLAPIAGAGDGALER